MTPLKPANQSPDDYLIRLENGSFSSDQNLPQPGRPPVTLLTFPHSTHPPSDLTGFNYVKAGFSDNGTLEISRNQYTSVPLYLYQKDGTVIISDSLWRILAEIPVVINEPELIKRMHSHESFSEATILKDVRRISSHISRICISVRGDVSFDEIPISGPKVTLQELGEIYRFHFDEIYIAISGGIDSRYLLAEFQDQPEFKAVTFLDTDPLDEKLAERVARENDIPLLLYEPEYNDDPETYFRHSIESDALMTLQQFRRISHYRAFNQNQLILDGSFREYYLNSIYKKLGYASLIKPLAERELKKIFGWQKPDPFDLFPTDLYQKYLEQHDFNHFFEQSSDTLSLRDRLTIWYKISNNASVHDNIVRKYTNPVALFINSHLLSHKKHTAALFDQNKMKRLSGNIPFAKNGVEYHYRWQYYSRKRSYHNHYRYLKLPDFIPELLLENRALFEKKLQHITPAHFFNQLEKNRSNTAFINQNIRILSALFALISLILRKNES